MRISDWSSDVCSSDLMANVHKIADLCSGLPVGTMYDGTVLNVSAVANADIIHIATHHRIKPKTTIVSGYYIPYNGGVSCNETILASTRFIAIHWYHQCHDSKDGVVFFFIIFLRVIQIGRASGRERVCQ